MGLLQRVSAGANEAATADEALGLAVTEVCKSIGWPVGHVYRPVVDGSGVLVPTDIWYVDDLQRFAEFRAHTMAGTVAPGVGLPGRVAASAQPAWVTDLPADAAGIRAGV